METQTVRLERFVRADIERAFNAFADPAQAQQWWGPPGVETSVVEIDLRVGGACRWVMHPSGTTAVLYGRIEALVPPSLLVMTNRWEGEVAESLVTLRFVAEGDGTRIELTHTRIDPTAGVSSFEAGWSAAFDSLETYLATTSTTA